MKKLALISLTCLVCLPTPASAETIKTTGIEKTLQAEFEYQLPCTSKAGVPGASKYYVFVKYEILPESLHPSLSKGETFVRVVLESSCSGDGYYDADEMQGYTGEVVRPGETTAFINPNLRTGNLYAKLYMQSPQTLCVYEVTTTLNFEAISNPTTFVGKDKTYYTEQEKIIFHGVYREALAKATGQLTLKPTSPLCNTIPSPPNNYTAFPSTSARIVNYQYHDVTIIKK